MKRVTIELTDEEVKRLVDFSTGIMVLCGFSDTGLPFSVFNLEVVLRTELFTSPTDVRDFLATLFKKIIG